MARPEGFQLPCCCKTNQSSLKPSLGRQTCLSLEGRELQQVTAPSLSALGALIPLPASKAGLFWLLWTFQSRGICKATLRNDPF